MPNKNTQIEILNLDPQGVGEVLDGTIEMLREVAATANFCIQSMETIRDKGGRIVTERFKGTDPELEWRFDTVKEVLESLRDKLPERLYTLFAINQKAPNAPEDGEEGKPN